MQVVYKKQGETPLECIQRHAIPSPNSYAGRLDPMARGVLLILKGEECKKREHYLNLPKTYHYSFVLGISTDTYDYLGIIQEIKNTNIVFTKKHIESFIGKKILPYPHFSSKPVKGKPLFQHARENTLENIDIPEKEIEIYTHTFFKQYTKTGKEIAHDAIEKIHNVNGDFRQERCIEAWHLWASKNKNSYTCIDAKVTCSSGTYVRQIVVEIGKTLNMPAVTTDIERISVGPYTI